MSKFLDKIGRFFNCFKKQDQERDEFTRIVGIVDTQIKGKFDSKVEEYTKKTDEFLGIWLEGEDRRECKSMLKEITKDIHGCFDEVRGVTHDAIGYEPPSKFERLCGRVEQLWDDMFGD